MSEKDAAVIKALELANLRDERELTPDEEDILKRALDPDEQFFHDVEKLFTPKEQDP